MSVYYLGVMGRRPGISSGETRRDLLAATMKVLSLRGYAGARVSEIAAEAGVTSGAIYKHFASKDELLTAAVLEHMPAVVSQAMASLPGTTIIELIHRIGYTLPARAADLAPAMIELMATAAREENVADLVCADLADRERVFEELIRLAQSRGEIDPRLDPEALSRYTTMVVLGSIAAAALDLKPVDRVAWDAVVGHMIDAVRPPEEEE